MKENLRKPYEFLFYFLPPPRRRRWRTTSLSKSLITNNQSEFHNQLSPRPPHKSVITSITEGMRSLPWSALLGCSCGPMGTATSWSFPGRSSFSSSACSQGTCGRSSRIPRGRQLGFCYLHPLLLHNEPPFWADLLHPGPGAVHPRAPGVRQMPDHVSVHPAGAARG